MKEAMKRNKDIIKKTIAKAFTFKCISCNKMVETNIVNGTPVGKYCETKNCSINISQIMVNAMEKMKQVPMNDEKELKMSKFATETYENAIIQIMLELNEDKSILDGYKKLYPSKFSDK
jgi:hypothetical protein